jgi:hypothetical protein
MLRENAFLDGEIIATQTIQRTKVDCAFSQVWISCSFPDSWSLPSLFKGISKQEALKSHLATNPVFGRGGRGGKVSNR